MNAAVPMTITHGVLLWTLLGFLLIWMILFTVLAFRRESANQSKPERGTAPGSSISLQNAHTTPAVLYVIAAQPVSPHVGAASYDASSNDVGTTASLL